ncbi:FKBP-type peptidyl-prolyl cis-trans isomerase [Paraburkholderia sp. UCT31]|uniref:FKBP-type peptidyl-prolyl cis-trans isomerase n=1 Tax=Paraburkholderia sp. UCT31 TaxID=2615209 RepID=UPI0016566F60|nr:FKBP-type peptidyl-prolyl cis-trans isomerase [Paraburkholderia sp. UCT31]MBC8741686.1 FKBP-type peptidyl-prolyl cis-trans isomerase [Paraburkholderia sp. UCT31]
MKKSLRAVSAVLLSTAVLMSAAHAAAPAVSGATETLPSGVTVQQLKEGTGAQPKATDTVQVNYRGTLADGTEFDSSYKRGMPATFPLNHVVPCFSEGLQHAHVGGKVKLVCPPATAYGSHAVGAIPPNSTLTFEVELLGIQK